MVKKDNLNRLLSSTGADFLPDDEKTLLLRACLLSGDKAHESWKEWQLKVGDPKRYMLEETLGLKGLLPFIEYSLNRNGILGDENFQTYLRVAHVRENLRSDIYRDILRYVLAALSELDIPVILLKGCALSETMYPQPSVRHNHSIDLLIEDENRDRAVKALSEIDIYHSNNSVRDKQHHISLKHKYGLPVMLHSRPFYIPHYQMPIEGIWKRSLSKVIMGETVNILSPADNLLHICGHASYSRSRSNLRWVCDAWFILDKNPEIDWDTLLSIAVASKLALSFEIMIRYLVDNFDCSVPEYFIEKLSLAAKDAGATGHEALLVAMLESKRSPKQVFKNFAGNPRGLGNYIKFALLPSPMYLRWRYDITNPLLLAGYYIYRPIKLTIRRLFHRNKRPHLST